jgi:hypothetical protein
MLVVGESAAVRAEVGAEMRGEAKQRWEKR